MSEVRSGLVLGISRVFGTSLYISWLVRWYDVCEKRFAIFLLIYSQETALFTHKNLQLHPRSLRNRNFEVMFVTAPPTFAPSTVPTAVPATTDARHRIARNGIWSGSGPPLSATAYPREGGPDTLHIQSVALLRGPLDVLLVSMNEIGAAYAYGRFIDCARLYLGRHRRRRRQRRRLHRAVLTRECVRGNLEKMDQVQVSKSRLCPR